MLKALRKKVYISDKRGIGLIEVIAALAIAVIVITALVSMAIFTLRSSLESKLLLESTKQANVELELIRALRDSYPYWDDPADIEGFWDDISACEFIPPTPLPSDFDPCNVSYISNDDRCFIDTSTGSLHASPAAYRLYPPGANPLSPDKIEIFFVIQSLDMLNQSIRASVYACWNVAGNTRSTSVHTDFTNWQNR